MPLSGQLHLRWPLCCWYEMELCKAYMQMSGVVLTHAKGFLWLRDVMTVVPWEIIVVLHSSIRQTGSFNAGTCTCLTVLQMMSLTWLNRKCLRHSCSKTVRATHVYQDGKLAIMFIITNTLLLLYKKNNVTLLLLIVLCITRLIHEQYQL